MKNTKEMQSVKEKYAGRCILQGEEFAARYEREVGLDFCEEKVLITCSEACTWE